MGVEELDLGDGGCADEAGGVVELRADFHADGAADAVRQRVGCFLRLWEDARARAEIIGAVYGDPGFDGLEVFEEDAAVDGEVADYGELGQRLDADGLLEFVDERGASHTGFAIDDHGAGAADFFEAVGVVGDGRRFLAGGVDRVGGYIHHGGDDVHAWLPRQLEFLPGGLGIGAGLTLDFDLDGFGGHLFLRGLRNAIYWA